jgi:chemotaxis response regulator CheB
MKLTTLLVCDAGLDKRQTIEDLIHSQPSLALVSTVSGSMAREQIGSLHPKLVWIELSPAPVRGLSLLAELRETFPQLYFFVSYEVPDPYCVSTRGVGLPRRRTLAHRLAGCRSEHPVETSIGICIDRCR